jgi:general secretion pathway protein K
MNPIRARRQCGIAFIVVLWLLALLSIVLGSFALLARSESLQARHYYDGTRARYAAEAGIAQAAYALAFPDQAQRWLPDGRPYTLDYADMALEIRITDESGKLDINAADEGMLARFFEGQGLELERAVALAAAIIDWRDPDDLLMPNGAELPEYEAADLRYGPANAPFVLLSELQQVLGMNYELFQQVAPLLTVHSGQPMPNPAFAAIGLLQSLPGLDPELARQIIALRESYDPASGLPPPLLPDGSPAVAPGGTGTYSIRARATLPNGAWTELDSTIRLGGGGHSGLAYTVLRWQEGATP